MKIVSVKKIISVVVFFGLIGIVLIHIHNRIEIKNMREILASNNLTGFGQMEKYIVRGIFQSNAANLLNDSNENVKIRTLNILSVLKKDGFQKYQQVKISDRINKLLLDNNWRVRFFAAEALSAWNNNESVSYLVNIWPAEKEKSVQIQIAAVLADIAGEKDVPLVKAVNEKFGEEKRKFEEFLSAFVLYKITREKRYLNQYRTILAEANKSEQKTMLGFLKYVNDRNKKRNGGVTWNF